MFTTLVTQPLFNLLILFSQITPQVHLAAGIILLTLLVRLILLPSSYRALKSQRKLQALSGKITALRDTHKEDQKKQTAELLRLYREEGVHPLSSCLPLLIQFPVLIGLYQAVREGLSGDGLKLLYDFIPHPEKVTTSLFGLNLAEPDRLILPLVTGALTYWQMKQIALPSVPTKSDDPMASFTKQSRFIFPIMTIIFSLSLPAALPLYWATSSFFSIVQQWWFDRIIPMSAPVALAQGASQGKGGVSLLVRKKD